MQKFKKKKIAVGFVVLLYLSSFTHFFSFERISIDTNFEKSHIPDLSDPRWMYIREISLNPVTPQSNYQVKIQLNTSNFNYSRVKIDGSDLRFYDPDEIELSYWIEEWNIVGISTIWVKVPDAGTSKIYMEYGYSLASPKSNGATTFDFFDDFEIPSSGWNVTGSAGIAWHTGGNKVWNNYSLAFVIPMSTTTTGYLSMGTNKSIEASQTYKMEMKHKTTTGGINTGNMGWQVSYYNSTHQVGSDSYSGALPKVSSWSDASLFVNTSSDAIYFNVLFSMWWYQFMGTLYWWFDGLRLRKYVDPEPVASVGDENGWFNIVINSPSQNEFFSNNIPNFDIYIDNPLINTTWYTIDSGITNITFSGSTGTIDESEWDKKGDGHVIIRFYENDTRGYIGYNEVTVHKDIMAPTSLISYKPYGNTNLVNRSTTFTITADDDTGSGVSVIRYKVNNSGWIDYDTFFDLSLYVDGFLLIQYYSIDNLGNTEGINTLLVKLIEISPESSGPSIIGYNTFLLLGILCVISIIFVKYRIKIFKK